MATTLPLPTQSVLTHLVTLVGIYFQIRDDYQNLSSAEYTSQKGFCEDLDEGKISFPLIHYLSTQAAGKTLQVREVMQQRRDTGRMTMQQKELVLNCMKEAGSLDYTRERLRGLERQCTAEIGRLEGLTGKKNWVLRLCMHKLAI
jgi:geranylgeranyl pyrophosphate synthase